MGIKGVAVDEVYHFRDVVPFVVSYLVYPEGVTILGRGKDFRYFSTQIS